MLLDGLFHPAVQTAEIRIGSSGADLFPQEAACISEAVPERRQEFSTGRACARSAMQKLGFPSLAIPMAPDRAPVWPAGLVGTISHCQPVCAAALARQSDGFLGLGLDIEAATPLEEEFAEELCTPLERHWLDRQPAQQRGLLLKILFSAKECTYKCQYPLSGMLFGFEMISVRFNWKNGCFDALFQADAPPFDAGHCLTGRFRIADGYIVTTMGIRGQDV